MNSHSKLGVGVSGHLVEPGALKSLGTAPEAACQRQRFIRVAQLTEKAPDLVGAFARIGDDPPGGLDAETRRPNIFEQEAIEIAAIFRTFGIDTALAAIMRYTRLEEFWATPIDALG